MPAAPQKDPIDWVTRAADDAIRHAGEGKPVTVASGASPSGPIHLGNLREFLTPHFVAEELRRRGVEVRHLHSWDDYDRYRKVPAGVPAEWVEHIGKPLTAVPDPWECHANWSDHFKAPLRDALAEMGVEMEEISQTERYQAGAYVDQVLHAIAHRDRIEDVLSRYRTKPVAAESEQEAEALADSVTADEESAGAGDFARFPYKPYCRGCGKDTTTITAYDDETTDLAYTCDSCGESHVTNVRTQFEGKLVWKVDWPMRWAYEGVNFEPGGLDHSTPGSSYTVGKELVAEIFDGKAPSYVAYAFVGFAGRQKMSSSAGGVPIPADALKILEAPMVRWLYVRRQPKQAFNIDFGPEVVRLYDEWDSLTRKAANPEKRDAAVLAWERASSTAAAGTLPTPAVVTPFRLLSSVADVTAGNVDVITSVVAGSGYSVTSADDLEPRLRRAMAWMSEYVPAEDRTTVRLSPASRLQELTPQESEWISLLLEHLPETYTLEELTTVIYGVPKLARGFALEDQPTDEVKADQKAFFALLYDLLVAAERGPRLPTLFLALGDGTVRNLLSA
ncbi:lysine--tRNA ligase [Nocardioides sp. Kera G14]|uniref:lysine--tRNA ligase n=1 Tax=Nocardioides sp. Kera G14 TaxID=2884264 RepID=UPI001D101D63|nr:lysine--tRNA ligase [Nocardioides sp. Kera G14]UDY23181.1 lysine--tRNA ligase [Nocardioides sp. Kera G14]